LHQVRDVIMVVDSNKTVTTKKIMISTTISWFLATIKIADYF